MLIFLVAIFLAATIASGVVIGMGTMGQETLILADNHLCACLENSEGHPQFVMGETRMFEVTWVDHLGLFRSVAKNVRALLCGQR